jgi:hypothetical protein
MSCAFSGFTIRVFLVRKAKFEVSVTVESGDMPRTLLVSCQWRERVGMLFTYFKEGDLPQNENILSAYGSYYYLLPG